MKTTTEQWGLRIKKTRQLVQENVGKVLTFSSVEKARRWAWDKNRHFDLEAVLLSRD